MRVKNTGSSQYKRILNEPVSDVLYRDFDNDGVKELLVLSPFHGDRIKVFKENKHKEFIKVYEREKKMPFAHAIWGGKFNKQEYAFIGGRAGEKELIALFFDQDKGIYTEQCMDVGAGAANCMLFQVNGDSKLLAANRENNEVSIYSLLEEG